ncbi:MAG: phosphoribosylanthranilate isomerase [Bacteroidota bacterium]
MKFKVCGMKYQDNINAVAELQPDYLGFIFWKPSSRYFEGRIPDTSDLTKKVGVFVDAPKEDIVKKVKQHQLQAVQLHGKESPEYCLGLRQLSAKEQQQHMDIIKVFSVKEDFDFSILKPYETVCDFYMFDTKGKLPGGNGYTFNWELLKGYPSTKPYFLSGGIGLESNEKIASFLKTEAAQYCHAIDVNSRFEIKPGLKDVEKLKTFKKIIVKN